MEDTKHLLTVMKTESEKYKTIKNNVIKMISNRHYIKKDGSKEFLLKDNNVKIVDESDNVFTFVTTNNDKYAVKIIFQKITTTGKQSLIYDFLFTYTTYKKILIANDYNTKVVDYAQSRNTQIFKECALLVDIISHKDQPQFEVLTPTETEKVKAEYNVTEYTLKKYLKNDPVVKYFDLKKGAVVRIVRPSPTTGYSIDYRVVV